MSDGYELHTCEVCGEEKKCRYIADPFDEDVNNATVMRWLCDECYDNLCDDI